VLSLLMLVWRASNPSTVLLGRIPGTELYSDLARHPENEKVPGVLVFRANAGLFYANVAKVKDDLLVAIAGQLEPVKLVVFDLSSSPYADVAAADMLAELREELKEREIEFKVSNLTGEVRDVLRLADGESLLGDIGHANSVESIVKKWLTKNNGKAERLV
jgi:sulfate permease, SulP family